MNTERQDTKSILLSASLIYTLAHLSPLAHTHTHTHTCLPVVSNVTQHHTTQRHITHTRIAHCSQYLKTLNLFCVYKYAPPPPTHTHTHTLYTKPPYATHTTM